MNRKLIWKYVLTGIVFVGLVATLTACGSSSADEAVNQSVSNEVVEETDATEATLEDTRQADAEMEVGSTEDVVEEMVAETTAEESQVEMVDFETWAKQEGNDEVCLVVWNEETGVQEIMPTVEESKKTYQVQDGDKFAVPHKINISYILVNDKEMPPFDLSGYSEIVIQQGELTQITIGYKNELDELIILTYLLK